VPPDVVAVTAAEAAGRSPATSGAFTVNEYAVEAVSPLIVAEVVVTVATGVVLAPWNTS
jgi:hypothetical protein